MKKLKKRINKMLGSSKKLTSWFYSISWKKRTVIIIAFITVVIVVVVKIRSNGEDGYEYGKVQMRDITEIVSESSNVETAGIIKVYSPTAGIIEEIYIKNGDIVGIDQELFKVKSTATEDDKASAYADLVAAQNTLKTAEQAKLDKQTDLEVARQGVLDAQQAVDDVVQARINNPQVYDQNEIDSYDSALTSARLTFNTKEKEYLEADTAIKSAQAALSKAQLAYDSTEDRVIKSPTIGTVANLAISVGSSILASTGTSLASLGIGETASPALTIANFSSNEIILAVNESDVSKVKVGQKAKIEPDAFRAVEYEGQVKRVDSISHDDEGVIVYNVYIDILDPDEKLKSGMTVDVDIVTTKLTNVPAVLSSAIKPYQGGRAVRMLNKKTNKLEYIPIVVGVQGQKYTQVLEGVDVGQEIVVSLSNEKIKRESPLGF